MNFTRVRPHALPLMASYERSDKVDQSGFAELHFQIEIQGVVSCLYIRREF